MDIILQGIQRITVVGYLIFLKTIKILNLIHAVGLPVVRTVDEGIFEIAPFALQVVEREGELFAAFQSEDGESHLIDTAIELHARDVMVINLVEILDIAIILGLSNDGRKQQDEEGESSFYHGKGGLLKPDGIHGGDALRDEGGGNQQYQQTDQQQHEVDGCEENPVEGDGHVGHVVGVFIQFDDV